MTNEAQSKMLERVRALLAKADGTDFPEEAATFRAKADQLMTKFSIDQWMVEQAQAGVGARQEPERRDFMRSWAASPFRQDLFTMFSAVAEHCRCVVGYRGQSYHSIPVYGLPSDLDYLDLLFTTLNLEVAKNMDPPVRADGEPGHEVFKQRQAGISWPRIAEKMYRAGLVSLTPAELKKLQGQWGVRSDELSDPPTWEQIAERDYDWTGRSEIGEVRASIKNRLANYNRRYVKDHHLQAERNYVKPEVYQRSFMYGFTDEVRDRIWGMSEASRKAYDAEHEAGSMALAVRDMKQAAMDLYKQQFPPPPPIPVDPNYKPKPGRAVKVREVAIDYGAVGQGRKAGRAADLSAKPSRRVGGDRKRLDS
jgi:hypothetical protein